jgi:ABC-type sugar transport system permease subunit
LNASWRLSILVISKPFANISDFLFFGIKGKQQSNEFQLQVYDKFISPSEPFNPTTMFIIIIAILSALLLITITLLVVILTKNKIKKANNYSEELTIKY